MLSAVSLINDDRDAALELVSAELQRVGEGSDVYSQVYRAFAAKLVQAASA